MKKNLKKLVVKITLASLLIYFATSLGADKMAEIAGYFIFPAAVGGVVMSYIMIKEWNSTEKTMPIAQLAIGAVILYIGILTSAVYVWNSGSAILIAIGAFFLTSGIRGLIKKVK